jgi:hypothetical protein
LNGANVNGAGCACHTRRRPKPAAKCPAKFTLSL